jgi:hypothetical protein
VNTLVLVSFLVLILSISLIVYFFVSLAKQGDERQKYIKDKTIIESFYITLLYLISNVLRMVYTDFIKGGNFGLNPLAILAVISCTFLIILLKNNKKYGD